MGTKRTKALLIGRSIVGGIFVGFVAYKVAKKKSPKFGNRQEKGFGHRKKTFEIVTEAKQAFSAGFT